MSLSSAYSPKIGMSGSFGSSHCLTNSEVATLRLHRKTFSFPGSVRETETTKLVSLSHPPIYYDEEAVNIVDSNNGSARVEPTMSWSLLITILVVTVGSSLQFGYAKLILVTHSFAVFVTFSRI